MKRIPQNAVLRCFTRFIMVLVLFAAAGANSSGQEITNRLQGYFQAAADTALYSYFAFDGNGKVDIMGLGDGYYFQKEDSVIVYPDKSIFKFLLKDGELHGVSQWVEGGVWQWIKDSAVESRRADAAAADRIAGLLHQYYELKTRDETRFLMGDDDAYAGRIKSLCDSGLSKACLDYAGLKIIENMGGIGAFLDDGNVAFNKEADPAILAILEKAIGMGDMEGYAVLGGYYAMLQDKQKAKEVLEKGGELGCRRCIWAAFSIAMEEEATKAEAADPAKPAGDDKKKAME